MKTGTLPGFFSTIFGYIYTYVYVYVYIYTYIYVYIYIYLYLYSATATELITINIHRMNKTQFKVLYFMINVSISIILQKSVYSSEESILPLTE